MDGTQISYEVDVLKFTPSAIPRFRALRLEALRAAPSAFLSTYEREKGFTDSQWGDCISDPTRHYLICHRSRSRPPETDAPDIEAATDDWAKNDAWVGMLSLHGPFRKDEYGATSLLDGAGVGNDEEETRWHMSGLYLQPDSKCKESAIAIHEAILDFLRLYTDRQLATIFDDVTGLEKPKSARLAGFLRTENDQLRALYEALGAQHVGWADEALARQIAGLDGLPDTDPTGSLRMRVIERVIEC